MEKTQYDIFADRVMQIQRMLLKENAALTETATKLVNENADLKKQLKELQDKVKK